MFARSVTTVFTLLLTFLLLSTASAQALSQRCVTRHNQHRAEHSAPPVVWNQQIAAIAQRWANRCTFGHSGIKGYGENVASGHPSPEAAITAWVNERQVYSYQNPVFSSATGHFTQVVWKGTKEVGCGWKICPGGKTLMVCNYKNPGNYQGQFEWNVLPPAGSY